MYLIPFIVMVILWISIIVLCDNWIHSLFLKYIVSSLGVSLLLLGAVRIPATTSPSACAPISNTLLAGKANNQASLRNKIMILVQICFKCCLRSSEAFSFVSHVQAYQNLTLRWGQCWGLKAGGNWAPDY